MRRTILRIPFFWGMMALLVGFVGLASSRAQTGTNLLANGGFESGVIAPYGTYGNCTARVATDCGGAAVSEGPAEGKYCLHIVVPAAGANDYDIGMTNNYLTFRKGKTYRFSCFMKTKSGTLQVRLKPEHAESGWEAYNEKVVTVTDRWQEFTTTTPVFTADVTPASPTFHFGFAPGDFWIDNIKLEEIDPGAKYGGGTGTADDPIKIATAAHLDRLGQEPTDWDKHFILVDDIDLSGYKDTQFHPIGGWYEDPAPNNRGFRGSFDGQGHRIRNFTWTSTGRNYIGLFRMVEGGQIRNVGLENVRIKTNGGQTVGALVGLTRGASVISGCYSTGTISALREVGGLVGSNQSAEIRNCWSSVDIVDSGWSWNGGLVGANGGPLVYCYATGRVAGAPMESGGLCGMGSGAANCYWDVETSNRWDSVGGSGKTTAQMMKASTYYGWESCGNEGVWTINEGKDYPHLAWEGKPGVPLPKRQLTDSVPGSGTRADPYVISTAEQLNLIGLFPCAWDKCFVLVNDLDLKGYKDKQFNVIGAYGFTGVFDGNGHTIRNFSRSCALGAENIGLFSISSGQIKNLGLENINVSTGGDRGMGGGLVGSNEGSISNCLVTGRMATNGGGGIAGTNRGRIDSCSAIMEITGTVGGSSIGGLVGDNQDSGRISNSYATGKLAPGRFAGGLVAFVRGTSVIENCYSMCSLSDISEAGGGLVGMAGVSPGDSGLIVNCYSTGAVRGTGNAAIGGLVGVSQYGSTFLGCFWDTQTSGLSTSAAGTGRTTAQMQTAKTFLDAGWDFVAETANGADDLWKMPAVKGYPMLFWQQEPALPPAPPRVPVVEGFESGLTSLPWSFAGGAPWTVVSSESHSGGSSAQAGAIGDDGTTSLSVKLNAAAGKVSFWLKVSSEPKADFLIFSIDGKEQGRWSGEMGWQKVSFSVAEGLRTFTWTYQKDNMFSEGQDTAWIDDIVFPDSIKP